MVEFSDDEWNDLLDTLRIEVIRAGYADWDRSAFAAMETDGRAAAVEDYLTSLIRLLKIGSGPYRTGLRSALSNLVQDADGRPVAEAYLVDDEGYEQASLLDGRSTDQLLAGLTGVHDDLFSGGGGYYGGGR